jgi:hypothetical protein
MVSRAATRALAPRCRRTHNRLRARFASVITVAMVVAALVLPVGNAIAQGLNLNGEWHSQYSCPSGETLPLVLRIEHSGQTIRAVTARADACLYAGTIAFQGNLYGNTGNLQCGEIYDPNPSTLNPNDNSQSFGDFLAQALVESLADGAGGPGRFAVRYAPGPIQVISAGSIAACGLVFTRVGAAPVAAPVAPLPAQQATAGPVTFYCSTDGRAYAQGKGGILCPTPRGTVPTCPNGYACTCIDSDGSCTDGDDDWGYRPLVAAQPAPVAPAVPGYTPPAPVATAKSPLDSLTRTGRDQWQQYERAGNNRAFALSPSTGSFGWRKDRKSVGEAEQDALNACRVADCAVISVNGGNPNANANPVAPPAAAQTGAGNDGYWKTNWGDLFIQINGQHVTGSYSQDNGEIIGTVSGNRIVGHWIENNSDHQCRTARGGRYYWGPFEMFFGDGTFFARWGHCDGQLTSSDWRGNR